MLHVFTIKVSVWSVHHFVSVVTKSQTPNYAPKTNLAEVKADIQTEKKGKWCSEHNLED